ncbi:S-adenosyl-L-methionine-dependent methyltransferase [Nemania serpens]|nr:S-adenosyl-L-methionine-dependent methyltransferase [Nemania serpens]
MEQETFNLREPPTSSASSQSETQPEWDATGRFHYGGRATPSSDVDDPSLEPGEFWPQSNSEDDSESDGGGGNVSKRTTTAKSGSTTRRIKAMLQKFGRSYNGSYEFLPNDSQEKDENTIQHDIVVEVLDGKLYLAPVVNPQRILDLGCGAGNWPLEFARRNPNAFVLGVDVEPIRPPFSLPNCQFQVANFEERWSYDSKFDFIHLRHLGRLPSQNALASVYENLSPGGWAEFTEWVVAIQSTHKSFTETSFYKWWRHWKRGLKEIGQTVYYPLQYKRLLTETGFKNVTERKYAVPVNPWPPGKQLQRIGSMMAMNINTLIEPLSMPVFTKVLGWSPEALQSLLAEVREEIADVNIHAYMNLFTVYAQKPRGESSSCSSVRSSELG